MKLKNDWSLAHFLYYISWFMIVGIITQVISTSLPTFYGSNSIASIQGMDPQVGISVESLGLKRSTNLPDGTSLSFGKTMYSNLFLVSDNEFYKTGSLIILVARFVRFIALFIFFFSLNRILKTVTKDEPYHLKNPTRLFIMGVSIMSLSLIQFIQSFLFVHYLSKSPFGEQLEFTPGFSGGDGSIIFGLAIVLLGFVFKEGARIHEEQKLTV